MRIANDTDRDWNKWGSGEPYFGVLSHSEFLRENLNDDSLSKFFATGQDSADAADEAGVGG